MTLNDFDWASAPLNADDQTLVEAYEAIRVPVDALPYTEDMDRLVERLGLSATDPSRRQVLHRLLSLRKRGLLPRIYVTASTLDE